MQKVVGQRVDSGGVARGVKQAVLEGGSPLRIQYMQEAKRNCAGSKGVRLPPTALPPLATPLVDRTAT